MTSSRSISPEMMDSCSSVSSRVKCSSFQDTGKIRSGSASLRSVACGFSVELSGQVISHRFQLGVSAGVRAAYVLRRQIQIWPRCSLFAADSTLRPTYQRDGRLPNKTIQAELLIWRTLHRLSFGRLTLGVELRVVAIICFLSTVLHHPIYLAYSFIVQNPW